MKSRLVCRAWVRLLVLVGLPLATAASVARAQEQRDTIPSSRYYAAYADLYAGEYGDALKGLKSAERVDSIKGANGRWIDSIAYHTAVGEVYYQLGDYKNALTQYQAALQQYLQQPTWMLRVNWPQSLRPDSRTVTIAWGKSPRPAPGSFSVKMPITLGDFQVIPGKNPGLFNNMRTFNINAMEILRSHALATRRYAELLGPLAGEDKLLKEVIAALESRSTRPNHWSQTMIDVMLGCAYKAAGKMGEAEPLLRRGLVADGQYDHPLASMALLELADIALKAGDFKKAGGLCEEATFSAVMFIDFGGIDTLQEAFHKGFIAHLLQGGKAAFPQAAAAGDWALREDFDALAATLSLDLAENAVNRRATTEAASFLRSAGLLIGKTDMKAGKLGARMKHLEAMIAYQGGDVADGDAAIADALAFQGNGRSLWLFHMALADDAIAKGGITTRRKAEQLYDFVLRDPALYEWQVTPLEALSKLCIPHEPILENWLEFTLKDKKGIEKGIEITDRIRRHRFETATTFGGRLTTLRWLLEGPSELLSKDAAARRKSILIEYPHYEQLQLQAQQLRKDLREMPLAISEDAEALASQQEKLGQLAALSLQQEAILREIAVRREDAPVMWPQLRTTKQVQDLMPAGQTLLMFYATRRSQLYAFMLTRDDKGKNQYFGWQVTGAAAVTRDLRKLLKQLGNHTERRAVPIEDLGGEEWKQTAAAIYDGLLKGADTQLPKGITELVVVPDGLLWYLPFELLQLPEPSFDDRTSLLATCKVRYVPMMCLAHPDARGNRPAPNLAVSVGKLFPGQEDGVAEAAFEDLNAAVPGAIAVRPDALPAPAAVYSALFDRLIVLDDLVSPSAAGPFGWSPLVSKAKGGQIDNWLLLPFGGPEQMILPGFHTAAENSLTERKVNGGEVFLSVCAMMANGSRTILLSRWRPGGKNSYDLVREFAKELPHATAAEAWRRSVFVNADVPLSPDQEPRMVLGPKDTLPKADHPFFWSGFLLIDTGQAPAAEEAVKAAADDAVGKAAG